ARVDAADVDAACNGDFAVDNQYLSVVRMREEPFPLSFERIDRVEFDDLNSPFPQALKKGRGIRETAHAVINEVDLNPFRLLFQHEVGKLAAHIIIVDDVGINVDMVPGTLNGF